MVIRYEVQSPRSLRASEQRAGLAEDLRQLRALGFNTVWFDFATDDDQIIAMESAGTAGLRAIVTDRAVDRYVRFGQLPGDIVSLDALAASRGQSLRARSTAVMLALPPFPSEDMADRGRDAARRLGSLAPPCETLLVGYPAGAARFNDVPSLWYAAWQPATGALKPGAFASHMLCVLGGDGGIGASWSETATRLQYYGGLTSGLTDGLLVWRFRSWPGESNGVAEPDGRIPPGTTATLQRLGRHAAEWGPLLAGARGIADEAVRTNSDKLRCAAYRRQDRRFILVYNMDGEHFAHGTLRIAATLDGTAVSRVIAQDTGARHTRNENTLTIPLHLAPAEAVAFEVH